MSGHNTTKSMGPRIAWLVAELYDRNELTFTVETAASLLGVARRAASNLVARAAARGIFNRLKNGLYTIVPFDLGSETVAVGNPYVVAADLAGNRPNYLSHASAMDLHGMTTQPQMVATIKAVNPPRSRVVHGMEIRFIRCAPDDIWGTEEAWATPRKRVVVSDIERTIVDCLQYPQHAGGYADVDKGVWMVRDRVNAERLVEYAVRLNSGVVFRRLGFLMESCGIGGTEHAATLRSHLTATYSLLDPTLPGTGPHVARWRLQVNVPPEELSQIRGT